MIKPKNAWTSMELHGWPGSGNHENKDVQEIRRLCFQQSFELECTLRLGRRTVTSPRKKIREIRRSCFRQRLELECTLRLGGLAVASPMRWHILKLECTLQLGFGSAHRERELLLHRLQELPIWFKIAKGDIRQNNA